MASLFLWAMKDTLKARRCNICNNESKSWWVCDNTEKAICTDCRRTKACSVCFSCIDDDEGEAAPTLVDDCEYDGCEDVYHLPIPSKRLPSIYLYMDRIDTTSRTVWLCIAKYRLGIPKGVYRIIAKLLVDDIRGVVPVEFDECPYKKCESIYLSSFELGSTKQ